jgi:hypothetical protein
VGAESEGELVHGHGRSTASQIDFPHGYLGCDFNC